MRAYPLMNGLNPPIQSAFTELAHDGDCLGARVGFPEDDPVTEIEPYTEFDCGDCRAWLQVWKGNRLVARLNVSRMAEITYGVPAECVPS